MLQLQNLKLMERTGLMPNLLNQYWYWHLYQFGEPDYCIHICLPFVFQGFQQTTRVSHIKVFPNVCILHNLFYLCCTCCHETWPDIDLLIIS